MYIYIYMFICRYDIYIYPWWSYISRCILRTPCNIPLMFWVTYNNLTATSLEWWLGFGQLSQNSRTILVCRICLYYSIVRYHTVLVICHYISMYLPYIPVFQIWFTHANCLTLRNGLRFIFTFYSPWIQSYSYDTASISSNIFSLNYLSLLYAH